MDRYPESNPDYVAEMEDRAAELVDRDRLLMLERDDWAQARADQHTHDCAVLTQRAEEWCAIKDCSGHPSDYGWRDFSWWRGVL